MRNVQEKIPVCCSSTQEKRQVDREREQNQKEITNIARHDNNHYWKIINGFFCFSDLTKDGSWQSASLCSYFSPEEIFGPEII